MITVFAEKPDMARTIAKALNEGYKSNTGYLSLSYAGQDYCITWGYGHLCSLFEASDYDLKYRKWEFESFPVIPPQFKIKLKKDKHVQEQFQTVKALFHKSEYIISATDPDQEGELIFCYVYTLSGCRLPWKRLWLHSTAAGHIREQMMNLLPPDAVKNLMLAARARAESDWLIGINSTVFYSLTSKRLTTLGRVQTPTLNMLVQREIQIQNHKSEHYWHLKAEFLSTLDRKYGNYEGSLIEPKKISSKSEAQDIQIEIINKDAKITDIEIKDELKNPPKLFDLSSLQKEANEKLGFSAKKTLDIVQGLYEKHLCSYPRTDWRALPNDMRQQAYDTACALAPNGIKGFFNYNIGKPYFDVPKEENSHYALIPIATFIPEDISEDEKTIFDMLRDSLIRIFLPPAVIEKQTVTTTVNGYDFVTHGAVLKEEGWTVINETVTEEILPPLAKGLDILNLGVSVVEVTTQPPSRYTDATLISAMKKCGETGIGRSSTRADIIEGLVNKKYIIREGKQLIPTEEGMQLILELNVDDLKSPELTEKWEEKLKAIREGQLTFKTFKAEIEEYTQTVCRNLKELGSQPVGKCPLCGGDITKRAWGWGCDNYSQTQCKFSISSSLCGKTLNSGQVKRLLNGEYVFVQGFTGKNGKTFDAKIKLDNGKIRFEF